MKVDERNLTGLGALSVHVKGDYAFVANGVKGLQTFDISIRSSPKLISEISTPGQARGIFVSRNSIFLADGDSGLRLFRILTVPPQQVAEAPVDGQAMRVVSVQNHVYVAAGEGGIQVFEVLNTDRLSRIGVIPTKDFCWACDGIGSRLYSANDGAGVGVYDISSGFPKLVGTILFRGEVFGVTALPAGQCIVCNGRAGIHIIDASDPTVPKVVSNVMVNGETRCANVRKSLCYVAAGFTGVALVDLTSVQNPVLQETVKNENYAWEADGADGHVYIADGSSGLLARKL